MIVGKVIGSIVSTRKSEKLVGNKFMIVEPLKSMKGHTDRLVAIDNIGAGIGEYVRMGGIFHHSIRKTLTGRRVRWRLRN